jgi:hypothetical protein
VIARLGNVHHPLGCKQPLAVLAVIKTHDIALHSREAREVEMGTAADIAVLEAIAEFLGTSPEQVGGGGQVAGIDLAIGEGEAVYVVLSAESFTLPPGRLMKPGFADGGDRRADGDRH